jgi:sugar (pentulose or hexulose) kinase
MIHKQQMGCQTADIVAGLCEALVRNYLSNIARGKDIVAPVVFQGGVAANAGIRAAFEKKLGVKLLIPEHYDIMGAIGAALVARQMKNPEVATQFKGFNGFETAVKTRSFTCEKCANLCEIVEVLRDDTRDFCMGGRCGRFD